MESNGVLALLLVCLHVNISCSFLLSNNDEYQVWLTTGDQTKKLSREAPCPVTSQHHGYSVWVDRNKRRQTIDGFGAALTNSAAYVIYHSPIRNKIITELFGSGINDLGISYLRLPMGSSDLNAVDPYTYDDMPNGQTDFNLNHFSIDKDKAFIIPVLKDILAVNPNLKLMATPWSAPAWMKTTKNLFGGEFINDSRYMQTYAQYFIKFFEAYKVEGITFDSFSVQNEPLLSKNDYPTMIINIDPMKAFIKDHLGPLLRQKNIKSKLLLWDYNWSGSWYPEAALNDGNVAQYVSGVAWHGYYGRHDAPEAFHNKHQHVDMYFTEYSGGGWNKNYADVLTTETRLIFIGQTKSWAKNVLLWNLALDEHYGPKKNVGGCNDCRGVITVPTGKHSYTKNVEYYAMGHMSKFVKPGAVRLEANYFNWDDLQCAAFQNPDGSTVIVVQNPNTSKSASFSLDIDAKHYQYNNLPPQSVVTFVK